MMTAQERKQLLWAALEKTTRGFHWEKPGLLAAGALATEFGWSRNLVSQYLNEFYEEGRAVKVNSRPVYFFSREALEQRESAALDELAFPSLEALQEALAAGRKTGSPFENLIGAEGSLSACVKQCKAALSYPGSGLPILLQGPTGTGKSMMARLLFDYGKQSGILPEKGRFVAVNCSEYANNPELLLTNLFGYKKGAYTGADQDRQGLLALANEGMLFLDEVHCLKAECQEKLFLFMDQGTYHMVGDNETWYHSKVRLIFATTERTDGVLLKTFLRRIPLISISTIQITGWLSSPVFTTLPLPASGGFFGVSSGVSPGGVFGVSLSVLSSTAKFICRSASVFWYPLSCVSPSRPISRVTTAFCPWARVSR